MLDHHQPEIIFIINMDMYNTCQAVKLTRNSTNLSRYPLSLGRTGLGSGGPGAVRDNPPTGGRPDWGNGGAGAEAEGP